MDIAIRFYKKNMEYAILKNKISLVIILLIWSISLKPLGINAQIIEECSKDSWCTNIVSFNLQSLTFPSNLWRIEDILNVYIENTTTDNLDIFMLVTVVEEFKGELFKVKSGVFTLGPGVNGFINPYDLEPIVMEMDYKFADLVQEIIIKTGSLPAGKYEVCVCALLPEGECIGSECIFQEITHPSPPELIYPVNESFVMEDLPVFSWLPPMPSAGEYKYTIEIVEMLDGQMPVEAMESNFRWFFYQSDLEGTSLQYPIADREFIYGTQYAWRIGAITGMEEDPNAMIMSPVWSFTFLGPENISPINEQYLVNLISLESKGIQKGRPFFEWELTNLSDPTARIIAKDEDIYFDFKVWKGPDSLNNGEPYYYVDKLTETYFSFPQTDVDTLKNNNTYFWQVSCIKNEFIIAESGFNQFSILSDTSYIAASNSFIEASESMLKSVTLGEEYEIFGVTDPIPPGSNIAPEEPAGFTRIIVNDDAYLFIIDDEPYSRYGHPVRYALVDKKTQSVDVYNANWFPEVRHSEPPDSYTVSGVANVKGTEINMLTSRVEEESVQRQGVTADNFEETKLKIDCKNFALVIDGGDKNRTGTIDNIASIAARDADSIQALYEENNFKIQRFSQYWDNNNVDNKPIGVDPVTKTGTNLLKQILSNICENYALMTCCADPKLNFEFFIYINGNAIPDSTKIKIYKPDGSGVCENIDYFEDILIYLQTLPQCVKITFFADANFSGSLVDQVQLDSYLKRGNYEIRTATDSEGTTQSGVRGSSSGKDKSFTEITLDHSGPQAPDIVNLGESYVIVNDSIKNLSKELKREYPDPQTVRVNSREQFNLRFSALNDRSEIKECHVIPATSANIILFKETGEVTVFSKIEGEIKVIVTYENEKEEIQTKTSRWGDEP